LVREQFRIHNHSSGKILPVRTHVKSLAGDFRSRKLRVVCQACNNGWMSDVQNKAKPILIPFLTGEWPQLTYAQQVVLATWAIVFNMVYERGGPPENYAISQEDRDHVRNHQTPPSNWHVAIASLDGADSDGRSVYFSFGVSPYKPVTAVPPATRNAQITFFGAGKVVFQTWSAAAGFPFDRCAAASGYIRRALGFQRVWPGSRVRAAIKNRRPKSISDTDFQFLTREFYAYAISDRD
jgi:hypothetical protein